MRKGENIRKRKDGRWEARILDTAKNKYVSVYAKTYKDVKDKKEKLTSKHIPTQNTNKNLTIKDSTILYLDSIKESVKPSTYSCYYGTIQAHINNSIGSVFLKDITQNTINSFISQKLKNGRVDNKGGLSAKTVKDITLILNNCLKLQNLHFNYKVPSCKNKEIRCLTKQDYQKLLVYLKFNTDNVKLGILIALLTGIRLGEICALKWKNIDFAEGCLNITHTVQRIKNTDINAKKKTKIIIDTPKSTYSIRTIPLQTYLLDIMSNLKREDDIFILKNSYKFMEPRTLQNKFKDILDFCKIEDINFHALRHTFATQCLEKNVDVKTLSEILGHSSVKFTLDRYVHTSIQHKKNQMEKLTVNF